MTARTEPPEGLLLAAGLGTRLRSGPRGGYKPLTRIAGVSLVERAVRGLELAGCRRILIVVGHGADAVRAELDGRGTRAPGTVLQFVENPRHDLGNGVSVLAARPHITAGRLILAMADHVVGEDVMLRAGRHTPEPDGATLLVDRKIASVFDLNDATRVWSDGDRVVQIGKGLKPFNAVDTGVFVTTPALFEPLDVLRRTNGDASLTEGVQALADAGRMEALDIGAGFWQDVDTPAMLAHAEHEVRLRERCR
jgi:1L-myo-inositol 1-phosphate cytidylyltransferase